MYIIIDRHYHNFQSLQRKKYRKIFFCLSVITREILLPTFPKNLPPPFEGLFFSEILVHANSSLRAHFTKSLNPPKVRGLGAGV